MKANFAVTMFAVVNFIIQWGVIVLFFYALIAHDWSLLIGICLTGAAWVMSRTIENVNKNIK